MITIGIVACAPNNIVKRTTDFGSRNLSLKNTQIIMIKTGKTAPARSTIIGRNESNCLITFCSIAADQKNRIYSWQGILRIN
jgi:hypothetical protein